MNKATQNFNNQNLQGKLVEVGFHPMKKKKNKKEEKKIKINKFKIIIELRLCSFLFLIFSEVTEK